MKTASTVDYVVIAVYMALMLAIGFYSARFNRGIHICFTGFLKDADQIARVSRIAIFESLSGRGLHPFAINEVLVNPGSSAGSDHGGAGHSVRCHKASSKLSRSIYATGPDETQQ